MRHIMLVSLLLVSISPGAAFGLDFPDDADWSPLTRADETLTDVAGDGGDETTDLVGEADDAAALVYVGEDALYVRLRLDEDPSQGDGLASWSWGLLLDADGDLSAADYALMVDGEEDTLNLAQNTSPGADGEPDDEAETPLGGYPVALDWADGGNVRLVEAGTSLNGTADWFLDFGVEIDAIEALGSETLTLVAGSGTSPEALNLDVAGCDDSAGSCTLSEVASDAITVLDVPESESECTNSEDDDLDGNIDCADDDCLEAEDALADADGDGLSWCQEMAYGTDPDNPDTDGGGADDETEVSMGLDPLDPDDDGYSADSDADRLSDAVEEEIGTDPHDEDSDDDGLDDFDEFAIYQTDPLAADSDGGGVDDGEEVGACGSDPRDPGDDVYCLDTDEDGVSDGLESELGSDPADTDSDDDGLSDGDEVNTWLSSPVDTDTDNDGLLDADEVNTYGTDPADPDSDDGGVDDDEELAAGTDPLDDSDDGTLRDADEDGLSNAEEEAIGTDVGDADTDGDGVSDYDEVQAGTDPLVAPAEDTGAPADGGDDGGCGGGGKAALLAPLLLLGLRRRR